MTTPTQAPSPETHNAPPEAHGVAHIVPLRLLAVVFASLILLTAATVTVSEMNLGNLSLYAAMAVATAKALLVILFFMHLRWDKGFNLVVFGACLIFAALFISLALTDTSQYQRLINPGQASGMESVHKPFGTGQPAR